MRAVARWTTPKYPNAANEDQIACGRSSGRFAISDGATESFDSGRWAKILATRFLRRRRLDQKWIAGAIAEYNRAVDRNSLPWMAQGAFDRGSFATVLGVEVDSQIGRATIMAVGDSVAALLHDRKFVCSHPYQMATEFNTHPALYSTLLHANAQIMPHTTIWDVSEEKRATIFCMTDALGAWFLKAPEERSSVLRSFNTNNDFADFVEAERTADRMKRDDTTLLVLE